VNGCVLRLLTARARRWTINNMDSRLFLWQLHAALKVNNVRPARRRTARGHTLRLLAQVEMDSDELECMLANMIFRGFVKGYIAHNRAVVLRKESPFERLSEVAVATHAR
jgi:hypothetical protein